MYTIKLVVWLPKEIKPVSNECSTLVNKAASNLNYLSYHLLFMELDLISILKEILPATMRMRITMLYFTYQNFLSHGIHMLF